MDPDSVHTVLVHPAVFATGTAGIELEATDFMLYPLSKEEKDFRSPVAHVLLLDLASTR